MMERITIPHIPDSSPTTPFMRALFYPASFIKHPNIGHIEMTNKLWPNLESDHISKRLSLGKLAEYYHVTYLMLCKDFETYEEYLQEQHWNNFKNKRKKIKIY